MSLPLPSHTSSVPLSAPTLAPLIFDEFGVGETDAVFTCVEPHLVVEGTLRTREGHGLAVLGEVHGAIVSEGTVFIGPGATVRGPVTAAKLIVAGELIVAPAASETVEAPIQLGVVATALLQIKRGGSVFAPRISYGELEADRGSRVRGEMLSSDSPAILRRPTPRVVHGAFPANAAAIPASSLKSDFARPASSAAKADPAPAAIPSPGTAAGAPASGDLGVLAGASASRGAAAMKPAAASSPQATPTDLGPVPTDLGPVSFSDSLGPIPRADRAAS